MRLTFQLPSLLKSVLVKGSATSPKLCMIRVNELFLMGLVQESVLEDMLLMEDMVIPHVFGV